MSCDKNRDQYFQHVATKEPALDPDELERLFQAGRNQAARSNAEQIQAEAKTRLLFSDMQKAGIKPPSHSSTGLPRKDAQMGYAKVYDHMKAFGFFARISQERQDAIAQQSNRGLTLVGLGEDETKEQVQRFPVWKHVPRCARCGRFMATSNPVCQNPRCALAGKKQHNPSDWPPAGANFKRAKTRQADYAANDALPKATIRVRVNGSDRDVTLERVNLDGTISYSEIRLLPNGVPIKGIGITNKSAVVAWEGQASRAKTAPRQASPGHGETPKRRKRYVYSTAQGFQVDTAFRGTDAQSFVEVDGVQATAYHPESGEVSDSHAVAISQPDTGTVAHCEHCGGFLNKDGNCNNPNCPGLTAGQDVTAENILDAPVEIEAELPVADELDEDELADTLADQPKGYDYQISDADNLGKGSAKAKVRANIEAIQLVKKLEEEGRLATPEEQSLLVKFVGWGGLPQVFDRASEWYRPDNRWGQKKPDFYDEYHELKNLLTEEEWNAASRSTVNAHYTSPAVIRGIYAALKHLGFDRPDGAVLEPACGIGHFFGLMPDEYKNARRVAVELDPLTARIAKHLYQNADVRNAGFQETNLPNDFFDLVISNVPFGNFPVVDKDFLGARRFLTRSIHNFFFAKALDKVKPGGTIAFVTSRYTMDSKDPAIRKYLSEHADLVGAIRLPNTAFKENAGTEVTTDIIFLRKRLPGEASKDVSWVETEIIQTEQGEDVRVNRYFADHPEMMLGKMSMSGSMYSNREATLESDGRDLETAMQEAIARLPQGELASSQGRCPACGSYLDRERNCNNPRCPRNRPVETRRILPEAGMAEGQYLARPEGVYRLQNGELVPHEKNGQTTKDGQEALEVRRIRGLVALNQAARQVLKLNVEQAEDADLSAAQAQLNQVYDDFVKAYGPVNSRANQRAASGDPNLPFLMALETDYDSEKNTARKEAIFEKRVISVNKTVEKADTPQDALRVSLNETGMINWERMAELTGLPVARLQKALLDDGLIFETPAGTWQTAEEYLSGNVRVKLAEAESAAALHPRYRRNVEALQAVKPRDLEPAEIKAPLGSPWIPPEDIAAFARAILRADFNVSFLPSCAEWKVTPSSTNRWVGYDKKSTIARQTWGTKEKDALTLLEDALNGKEPTVYQTVQDEQGNEKKVVDQAATIAAREAQAKIKAEFEKWLFTSDEERTTRLARIYNELYNSEVPRRFDGSHLTLPGMGANMPELRAHQKDAIWRISQGKNTLLAHIVGAGKTFSMIGGSMELRRTGLRKKPMHVVPNHMLEQYSADFYRMYPAARILAISADDVSEKRRNLTMSRIATGDWDAVIVTHSALGKLPVKAESEAAFLDEEIAGLRESLEAARQKGEKITVKELEKKLAREEAKLKEKMMQAREKQDNTITWDELGVDQLFVDEADLFKNLDFPTRRTRLAGVKGQASTRAQDLFIKLRVMRAKYGDNQSVVFATGTPIANSVSEMYNMQRFLDYDHLKDLGLSHFDNWASQFGDVVTSIEMKPSGGGYQTKSRFAQFNNVPELKRLFMRFADVQVDPDALNLRRPKLEEDESGQRRQRGVAVPASEELKSYIQSLVERAENLPNVDPKDDNMLKITSDGRKAALDMRLIDPNAEDNPNSKLNKAIENVFEIYERTTGVEVPGLEGKQNMSQMIFCDLGTPDGQGFNLYADIKRKLVARGVKPDEIAFMQDCKTDEDKFDLFQRVNAGQVRVLIGSTETMGAGTNAQRRLAALHHLDAPWRPRDVEQREGRILRQGNVNSEVGIYRYLTEESFDVYNWQLLERKARFIAQVMNRDLTVRSVEDIDAKALTYAEMKALATGNPAVIEKVAVDAELRKLTALEASWKQRNHDLQVKLTRLPREIEETRERMRRARASIEAVQRAYGSEAQREESLKTEIEKLRAWAKKTAEAAKQSDAGADVIEQAETAKSALQGKTEHFKRNGAFAMRIRSASLDDKDVAGDHLAVLENDLMKTPNPNGDVMEVGEYLGFALLAQAPRTLGGEVRFYLKLSADEAQLIPGNKDTGRTFEQDGKANNVARLRRALSQPEKRLEAEKSNLANLEREFATAQEAGGAFEHGERLSWLRQRAAELDAALRAIGGDKQQVADSEG